jgi:hypothetical protein
LYVVVQNVRREKASGQDRLQAPAHPRLAEAVDQRVEMSVAALDQCLFGGFDVVFLDGNRAIGNLLFHRLPCQGIDQPWLAPGELEGRNFGFRSVAWPRFAGGEEHRVMIFLLECLSEGREQRGLPCLPWRMEDEVRLLVDQPPQLGKGAFRRQHVVVRRAARTGRIEAPRHGTESTMPAARAVAINAGH